MPLPHLYFFGKKILSGKMVPHDHCIYFMLIYVINRYCGSTVSL